MSRYIKKEDIMAVAKGFTFTFAEERRRYMDFLEYCVDKAPTVYDLDKVVRELEEESFSDFKEIYTCNGGLLLYLEEAIKIVKRGAVNDSTGSN